MENRSLGGEAGTDVKHTEYKGLPFSVCRHEAVAKEQIGGTLHLLSDHGTLGFDDLRVKG